MGSVSSYISISAKVLNSPRGPWWQDVFWAECPRPQLPLEAPRGLLESLEQLPLLAPRGPAPAHRQSPPLGASRQCACNIESFHLETNSGLIKCGPKVFNPIFLTRSNTTLILLCCLQLFMKWKYLPNAIIHLVKLYREKNKDNVWYKLLLSFNKTITSHTSHRFFIS